MKTYHVGMLVTFNVKYTQILKMYQDLIAPNDAWTTYMQVFKNHYETNFEKVENLQTQPFYIRERHIINLANRTWTYYSVNTLDGNKLNMVIIPEFFEEQYSPMHNLGVSFEAFRINVKAFFAEADFEFNAEADEFFGNNVGIPKKPSPYEWPPLKDKKEMENPNYKKINLPEFKLKPYKFRIMNDKGDNLILMYGFKFYDQYALVLDGNSFKKIKVYSWTAQLSPEECVKQFAKVKIKDYTKSAEIFGYKPSKKEMFESNNLFKVNSIMFDYESKKTNSKLDVVELDNGTKSLKFILDELEFIFAEPKGFNVPSKINITKIRKTEVKGKTVRIVKDKGLPVKKNDRAVLVDMWNTHQPLTGSRYNKHEVSWDKDTKVRIKLNDDKTIICKLKNIKFVK